MGGSSTFCSQPQYGTLKLLPLGPVENALYARDFTDDKKLKSNFLDAIRSRGKEFYKINILPSVQSWLNCVENADFVKMYPNICKRV
jgi:hypothetical protein